ncbi:cytidine deaminase [Bacillus sp. FJAT-27264]|uniref:cytidine deaminase n=1 Tax=Paenibacillus sp. (strain DSM 101736 / FJAT-27264) TaxID=1850362 RepID=UPI000AB51CB9|nr:cytidine deaminase [Bacillus sp. FJAT-27264]
MTVNKEDLYLIDVARNTIKTLYVDGKHHVGAAVRTKTGKIYSAVHLEANIGRVSVCAEAIALGKAISEGESEFDTIVAVRHPDPTQENQKIEVVSPCGICRELISDYGKGTNVILKNKEGYIKTVISDLLPNKYIREDN